MKYIVRLAMLLTIMFGLLNATELTVINSDFQGVFLSSLSFGDYDNDCNMDLVVSGSTSQGSVTQVYNNFDGEFILADIALPGLSASSVSWVDFDNDGDIDLFITGRMDNQQIICRLYRNTNGSFIDTGFQFSPVANASSAWGDVNNDGCLDLILTGTINDSQCATKLYLNSAEGFVESDIQLPNVHSGSVKFGDFDNDGWLDVLITGISQDGPRISKIFRNDQGVLTDIDANLLAVGNSSVAWGDFDNDGWLDIALSGRTNSNEIVTKIYQNNTGSFVDTNATLVGVYLSSIAWADIDNNGFLDLVVTGGRTLTAPFNPYSAVYINSDGTFTHSQQLTGVCFSSIGVCDFDNDGDLDIMITGRSIGGTGLSLLYSNSGTPLNTEPTVPTILQVHEDQDYYYFTWGQSVDAQQPSISLSYSIQIGSSSGACDIVSPSSLPSGLGLLANFGSIHSTTNYVIRKDVFQPDTIYYWTCQAADNSFTRSDFAQEATFSTAVSNSDLSESSRPFILITPNPFNPSTTIEFSIFQSSRANLSVFNNRGQKVKTLLDYNLERGQHRVIWNGRDDNNRSVASGVYFIRLEAAGQVSIRMALLLK
ncbi:MAG: FG-GAP-like repeat-containing protein [Candidatus Cloacimonetes bacterium]|nr:FG-GAP-like repeat-containing protein [Candidatus Cloacimonadota bacterium]